MVNPFHFESRLQTPLHVARSKSQSGSDFATDSIARGILRQMLNARDSRHWAWNHRCGAGGDLHICALDVELNINYLRGSR